MIDKLSLAGLRTSMLRVLLCDDRCMCRDIENYRDSAATNVLAKRGWTVAAKGDWSCL
jgi:hypothetical protein